VRTVRGHVDRGNLLGEKMPPETTPVEIEAKIESLVGDLKTAVAGEVDAKIKAAAAATALDDAHKQLSTAADASIVAAAAVTTAESANTAALTAIRDYVTGVLKPPLPNPPGA
jgi:hypothetical protein